MQLGTTATLLGVGKILFPYLESSACSYVFTTVNEFQPTILRTPNSMIMAEKRKWSK